MDLRPELLPPSVDEGRLRRLSGRIEQIADLLRRGLPAADAAVTDFNTETGHAYTDYDFLAYDEHRSLEEFAREAARPAWPKVAEVSRAELIEIVSRIQAADPETDYYLLLLHANTPHPRVGDLIFHSPSEPTDGSAEAIVDAALSYRAIAL
ncbi:hypothetical protein [Catenulispora sp. GAS73]|uniref:hypothetical protein n=1 Tax=Catenulispora sp. GAS73 TaxID=3156269 RepID=UPI0035113832